VEQEVTADVSGAQRGEERREDLTGEERRVAINAQQHTAPLWKRAMAEGIDSLLSVVIIALVSPGNRWRDKESVGEIEREREREKKGRREERRDVALCSLPISLLSLSLPLISIHTRLSETFRWLRD
jgi:hypothetical protein